MKREVSREKSLPAFSIEVSDLEALILRLTKLFGEQEKIYSSIEIVLPKETLNFESVDELKNYQLLKGRINKFSFYLSGDNKSVRVRAYKTFSPLAFVNASAENEAWCAGAVETVYSFLSGYKLWYHWFVSAPIGWILFFLANVPSIVTILPIPNEIKMNKVSITGWFTTVVALAILYIFKNKLFPSTIIKITNEESFIRRNSAELGLTIAILSIIVSLFGIFLKN